MCDFLVLSIISYAGEICLRAYFGIYASRLKLNICESILEAGWKQSFHVIIFLLSIYFELLFSFGYDVLFKNPFISRHIRRWLRYTLHAQQLLSQSKQNQDWNDVHVQNNKVTYVGSRKENF